MDDLLATLNPRQYEAVVHGDGPLLVLAGAGSGKTRVLTHRLAHLVRAHDVRANRILTFTFTNRAAKEMRERIDRLVDNVDGLWAGTFHSICVRLLRRNAELVGRTSSFTIYDADDQRAVVKRCTRDLGYDDKELKPQVVHSVISQAKNRLDGPDAVEAAADGDARPEFMLSVARIYRSYENRLRDANAFDFDDLIGRSIDLLRDNADVLEHYARRFLHILVDEYQDTNHAQYLLITQLASIHRNLVVVGDDDQSIYSWRGADIQNILSFEKTYPEATTIRLEQNYRSTKTILRAANAVVKNNRGRKPKELWTDNSEGDPLNFWIAADDESEANAIVAELEGASRRGDHTFSECVILYRTHSQSRPIEGALRRRGIRYDIIGGVSFYERREVKDILAYLRLITSPRDDVSFLRVVNVPKRGIGQTTVERLVAWARQNELTLDDAVRRVEEIDTLSSAARRRLTDFCQLLDTLRAEEPMPIPALIAHVIDAVHYIQFLEDDDPVTSESRRENLDELGAAAAHYEDDTDEEPSLEGFLAEVALVAQIDEAEDEGDHVTLMSAHNAKGLEYDLVVIAGLEQGLFPHNSSLENMEEMEEERRLFYVALTRARKKIIMTAARRRWRYGTVTESAVSDFVAEVPTGDIEVVDLSGYDGARSTGGERSSGSMGDQARFRGARRLTGAALQQASIVDPSQQRTTSLPIDTIDDTVDADSLDPSEGWRNMVGEPVMHAQFGRGTVVGQEGFGPESRLTVRFVDSGVTKKVVARFLSMLE